MNSVCSRADLVEIEGRPSANPQDLEFCTRMLPRVSRTFALSIQSLPPELGDAVCIAYLLCRAVDTVEDDRALSPASRRALFAAFDSALTMAASGHARTPCAFEALSKAEELGADADRELCESAGAVFRAFAALPAGQRRVIEPRVLEMSSGMRAYSRRADVESGLRLRDLEDLERYCYYVAGTVGAFLTDLFLLACPVEPGRRSELVARSTRFGTGLQLVNILKDVAEDAERGDCFLPADSAEEHGVDLSRLFESDERPQGLSLLRALAQRTREHLAAAEEYTLLWPLSAAGRDVRLFCAGPLALALGTLQEIELGHDALVPTKSPTVSRAFVGKVFEEIRDAMNVAGQVESDLHLSDVFDRARVGVAGRPSRPAAPPEATTTVSDVAPAPGAAGRQERSGWAPERRKKTAEERP
jgi:farnesyl-diphosphate farnesyltransferase